LDDRITIGGGNDFGIAQFGLCKYAFTARGGYRFKKIPFITHLNLRFNDYKLNSAEAWTQIYNASIELTWRFKGSTTINR
jgi:hypothetical protein